MQADHTKIKILREMRRMERSRTLEYQVSVDPERRGNGAPSGALRAAGRCRWPRIEVIRCSRLPTDPVGTVAVSKLDEIRVLPSGKAVAFRDPTGVAVNRTKDRISPRSKPGSSRARRSVKCSCRSFTGRNGI
jgi:hypothetical protein